MDTLIEESQKLPFIPLKQSAAYKNNLPSMIQYVNDSLADEPSIKKLIGNNPLQVMYENHINHSLFMTTVFTIGNYELLAKTVPWVYRSYHFHNFSYEYFEIELKAWIRAIEKYIPDNGMDSIISVYKWMIEKHPQMIELSKIEPEIYLPRDISLMEIKNSFQTALINGNHRKCLTLAKDYIKSPADLENFYLQIIQPAMYDIGMLWELGNISVAQEHLASAITGRVMASMDLPTNENITYRGKIIVTCSPNEFHELGAWMLSDVFELDGWEVQYLGANTPQNDLINQIRDFNPDLLAISVTMPFNIEKARDVIFAIRNEPDLQNIKILVGGLVFNNSMELWKSIGADSVASNIHEAKRIAQALIEEK